jgi:DNA-binding response OmpR family regulator
MKKLKILIAEDDRNLRMLYEAGLSEEIFEIRTVDSGQAALKVGKNWQPDIFLLDIMLPGLSGFQVLKTIREVWKDRDTTVIMATALSSKDDVVNCIKIGIQGYIVKPFDPQEVEQKILAYHHAHRQEAAVTDGNHEESRKSLPS